MFSQSDIASQHIQEAYFKINKPMERNKKNLLFARGLDRNIRSNSDPREGLFYPTLTLMIHSYMSQCMRFPQMWFVRPAKAQTSLRIRTD